MKQQQWRGRKALGLCPRCGGVPVSGKVTCQACLEKRGAEHHTNSISRQQRGVCTRCETPIVGLRYTTCQACRDYRRHRYARVTEEDRLRRVQYGAKARMKLRQDVLRAYGGKCACCGETAWQFLTIDHINGDGKAHRAEISRGKAGGAFFTQIRRQGYPPGLQVLCANCHIAKTSYDGCPHKVQG
jgi:hypothetical protein